MHNDEYPLKADSILQLRYYVSEYNIKIYAIRSAIKAVSQLNGTRMCNWYIVRYRDSSRCATCLCKCIIAHVCALDGDAWRFGSAFVPQINGPTHASMYEEMQICNNRVGLVSDTDT